VTVSLLFKDGSTLMQFDVHNIVVRDGYLWLDMRRIRMEAVGSFTTKWVDREPARV
jgi:hypothetical protein